MMTQDNGKVKVLVNSVADHATGVGLTLSWQDLQRMIKSQSDNLIHDNEVIAWVEVDDHGIHYRVIERSEATPR